MAGLAHSTHGGRRSLCQNFGLNCSLYHMIGRCVSQQLSQVIPSTPVCEKESWLPVSTQFWVKIFRPQFLAAFSTPQPRWQTGEVEGLCR